MGVVIGIRRYKVSKLFEQVEKMVTDEGVDLTGKMPPRDLLSRILPRFGAVDGGNFYIQHNEYYENYNPFFELMDFVQVYYGLDDCYLEEYDYIESAVNAAELWEELFESEYPANEQ